MTTHQQVEAVLLDFAGLRAIGIPFSRPWLLRLERAGKFPRRIGIGGKKVRWLRAEVLAFIEKCATERDSAAAERLRAVRASTTPAGKLAA